MGQPHTTSVRRRPFTVVRACAAGPTGWADRPERGHGTRVREVAACWCIGRVGVRCAGWWRSR